MSALLTVTDLHVAYGKMEAVRGVMEANGSLARGATPGCRAPHRAQ